MSKLDQVLGPHSYLSAAAKERIKRLMVELVASFEVKRLPSNDPRLLHWQGYHQAQLDITEAIEKL